jgi:hypothetical protein
VSLGRYPGLRLLRSFTLGCYGDCQASKVFSSFLLSFKSGFGLFGFVAFPLRWQLVACAALVCYPHANGLGAIWRFKVSEEERGAPNLISGFSKLTQAQGRARAAPKDILVLHRMIYLSPSLAAVLLPVLIRHRSIARRRPTATIAFFFAAPVALGLISTSCHFFNGGYSG